MSRHFVPPYLLSRIADSPDIDTGGRCRRTLAIDAGFRSARADRVRGPVRPAVAGAPGLAWTVHTAEGTADLPGRPVRTEAEPASDDAAVDEAWRGIEATLALFSDTYGHVSYDGQGAPVSATVHYERDYANAFWDGENLVFGDGDGEVFARFTRPVEVVAHELTHAVIEHTAGLVYRNQAGSLNESVSDVFAACLKQRLLGQDATEGDWLIGEGLFLPGVDARALRSMSAPGTAYDDPVLGRDPQPADMAGYVVTDEDNGGVHVNSGIPNRAFQLAATTIGGSAAEGAGRIWWQALGEVSSTVDFAGFAAATVAAAGADAEVVAGAWRTVGVEPGPGGAPGPDAGITGGAATTVVEVRRSGGLVGATSAGAVDLAGEDPRVVEVRELVDRLDLRQAAAGPEDPQPDRFVYVFRIGGEAVTVPEQRLTDDLRRLVELLLR